MDYSPRKRPKMLEITSFDDAASHVPGVTGHRDPLGTKKPWTSLRKRQKMPQITSFDDATRVMYRGSRDIEILRNTKTVDYSPRKRQKMPDDATSHVPGVTGHRNPPGTQNHGL